MKYYKLFTGLALAVVLLIIMFATALADDYNVPIIVGGKTYTVTITAERGRVITATSTSVEIGDIILAVSPGADVITKTNLADMIISNDFPSFPAGGPGEVSVVHTAITNDLIGAGHLYIVVRNNTDDTIYNVHAEADLYDGDGEYLGTESNLYIFQPSIVPPGGISASFVYFSGLELSEDDTYEIFLEHSTSPQYPAYKSFVEIESYKKSERNSAMIGRIKNTGDEALTDIAVFVSCYDETTGSIDYQQADVNEESLAPGETARFNAEADCEKFLLYAMGQ